MELSLDSCIEIYMSWDEIENLKETLEKTQMRGNPGQVAERVRIIHRYIPLFTPLLQLRT